MITLILLLAAFICFVAAFFGWGRGIPQDSPVGCSSPYFLHSISDRCS